MDIFGGLATAYTGQEGAVGDFSPLFAAVRLAAGFLVTAGICVIFLWFLRKIQRGSLKKDGEDYGSITVVARAYLSPKKPLYLVKVNNRLLLLADSPNGLTRLTEFKGDSQRDGIGSGAIMEELETEGENGGSIYSDSDTDESANLDTRISPGPGRVKGTDFKTLIERALSVRKKGKVNRK